MPRKQIPRLDREAAREIRFPANVRRLQAALADSIQRQASASERRAILKKLEVALGPWRAAQDREFETTRRTLNAVLAAIDCDAVFGSAWRLAQRTESDALAEGQSPAAALRRANAAAVEHIRQYKPRYTPGAWRAMKHDFDERLGRMRPAHIGPREYRNPALDEVRPGVSRPVFLYDYASPITAQLDRIAKRPSREWDRSFRELFGRLPVSLSSASDRAWLVRGLNLFLRGKRGALKLSVLDAFNNAKAAAEAEAAGEPIE